MITGKPLEAFRKENLENLAAGKPFRPDVSMPGIWPEHMKKRYGELGRILLATLGIKREDKEGRNRLYGEMALLFGAPCLVVVCIPRDTLVEYAMLDVGLITQTLCLVAHGKGVGTCIMAAAVGYPDVLRMVALIPESRRIVVSVAMGYPESADPINQFERPRAGLSEFVRWVE